MWKDCTQANCITLFEICINHADILRPGTSVRQSKVELSLRLWERSVRNLWCWARYQTLWDYWRMTKWSFNLLGAIAYLSASLFGIPDFISLALFYPLSRLMCFHLLCIVLYYNFMSVELCRSTASHGIMLRLRYCKNNFDPPVVFPNCAVASP